jgi:uncharacterized protein YxeA
MKKYLLLIALALATIACATTHKTEQEQRQEAFNYYCQQEGLNANNVTPDQIAEFNHIYSQIKK